MRRLVPKLVPVLVPALVLACLVAYAVQAAGPWARKVWSADHGRDFASYYYAVQAAAAGSDPYDRKVLGALARDEKTRASVHPFFYPPPFLLVFWWVQPLPLETAYRAWYVMEHLFLLAVLLALWRWVPGRITGFALAIAAATFSPIPDNDWMGQVNLLVLAVTVGGLLAVEREKPWTGGALVGLACMLKMSPALLVAWWLLHRRWKPVLAACATAVILTLASLPVLSAAHQWSFYTVVLPGFGGGAYHGLTVPIALPANHSIPSLFHEIWPGGSTRLSTEAAWASRITGGLLLAGLAWAFRRVPAGATGRLCQVGAVVVALLILPVYTYEHHMVWMLVPYAGAVAALADGRLGRGWAWAVGVAYAVNALPLAVLNDVYKLLDGLGSYRDLVYYPLREAKFVAALVTGTACLLAGVQDPRPSAGGGGNPAR